MLPTACYRNLAIFVKVSLRFSFVSKRVGFQIKQVIKIVISVDQNYLYSEIVQLHIDVTMILAHPDLVGRERCYFESYMINGKS